MANCMMRRVFNTRNEVVTDRTSSFYELEPFDSIVQALKWRQIRIRVPLCIKKTLCNRFMLPNLIYVGYAATLLFIDFSESLNALLNDNNTTVQSTHAFHGINTTLASVLDRPIQNNPYINRIYFVLAIVNIIMAILLCWAWRERSVFDIVMIPEYLNIIQAILYLWSAMWYPKQDTLGGYFTMAVHKIELVASVIGLFAAIGWIVSWFLTYTRIFGRGYTLDDPDMIATVAMIANAIIYLVYNIQLMISPEYYESNMLYKTGDICDFIEACFCVFACLRDDDWFWFLPIAGQYGIALGRVQVEAKTFPQFGKSPILLTDACRRRTKVKRQQRNDVLTVPIFVPHRLNKRSISTSI
ncbi:unnamed protein product [Adineta ricciae]|uniref:Uncharacterized protein n=2 Tax=Adineta ricciae TaxID=249248 RepID=A0A814XJA5_ADIRI|nr:unnamed protein product [Adineta ricciae]